MKNQKENKLWCLAAGMSQIYKANRSKIVTIGIRDMVTALGQMVNADWHSFTDMSDFVLVDPNWCAELKASLTEQEWAGCKLHKIRSSNKTSCNLQIPQKWHSGIVSS